MRFLQALFFPIRVAFLIVQLIGYLAGIVLLGAFLAITIWLFYTMLRAILGV